MRTIKLTLAYDGTAYAGWQRQADRPTLQATLEEALAQVTGEAIRVTASGRTDAGVHALGQVVGLRTASQLEPATLVRALNARLPDDVAVVAAEDAEPDFHPTRDVVRKRYRYVIDDSPVPDLFRRRYAWQHPGRLDADAMRQAGGPLVGRHDFRSFETQWPNRATSVRTVYELTVVREGVSREGPICVEIEADGFLYNMVRTIVGTLVEVGRGARPVAWPAEVLAAQDRRRAGPTAPARGLFLVRVQYGPPAARETPDQCRRDDDEWGAD